MITVVRDRSIVPVSIPRQVDSEDLFGQALEQPLKHQAKAFGEWPACFGGAIKAVDGKYGGFVVKFTDSDRRDLSGEYFDRHTDFMLGVYPIKGIRALYDHGLDPSVGAIPIGDIVDVQIKTEGIWAAFNLDFATNLKLYLTDLEAADDWKAQQLSKAQRYQDMIRELLDRGALGWSSGAHPQSVRVASTGHIERWPIWEASATTQPAMPLDTRIQRVKVKAKADNLFEFERERGIPKNHAGVPGLNT